MYCCHTDFVAYTVNMSFLCFQLQEAFAKGLLQPGMNVRVEKSKKYVNNAVSDLVTCLLTCFVIHSKKKIFTKQ